MLTAVAGSAPLAASAQEHRLRGFFSSSAESFIDAFPSSAPAPSNDPNTPDAAAALSGDFTFRDQFQIRNPVDAMALSGLLILPQSFGNIYLGEMFSSYINVIRYSSSTLITLAAFLSKPSRRCPPLRQTTWAVVLFCRRCTVHRIHYFMLVVVVLTALNVLCEAEVKSHIELTESAHGCASGSLHLQIPHRHVPFRPPRPHRQRMVLSQTLPPAPRKEDAPSHDPPSVLANTAQVAIDESCQFRSSR